MDEHTEPYAHEYLEGRQSGLAGTERDANPYFTRASDAAGVPEPHDVWQSKYDIWRQGWMEGHALANRPAT